MSRYNPVHNAAPIFAAFDQWKQDCLIGDKSLFAVGPRWTADLLGELRQLFVESPDESSAVFLEKLKGQLAEASPEAIQLMAEMLWVLMLFQSNVSASKKRENIEFVWSWSGSDFPVAQPLMTDEVISGLGSAGQGFNRYRADELAWLIRMVDAFKKLPQGQREQYLREPWQCAEWLDAQPWARGRQMRHILLHLLFPETFERMASPNDKAAVVAAYKELAVAMVKAWPLIDLDKSLLAVRQAEEASVGPEVDFYESPWLEHWRPQPGSWLFSWNPSRYAWSQFAQDRQKVLEGGELIIRWSCASGKVKVGDTAFLLRTGVAPKGIIACGSIVNGPYQDAHWDEAKAAQGGILDYVDIHITDLRDPQLDSFVSLSELEALGADNQEWNPQSSGIEVKHKAAAALMKRWSALAKPTVPVPLHSSKPLIVEPARNLIFFGPPGTGKTHSLKKRVPKYEDSSSSLTEVEWIESSLMDTTWWQVVFMALYELGGKATVTQLMAHRYFVAKAKFRSGNSNLRATCWGSLQEHSLLDSTTVMTDMRARRAPYVFDKDSAGSWFLAGDWEESCAEWVERVELIKKGPKTKGEQRIRRYEFVTFHQSYSYEDFIEGIRPEPSADGLGVTYAVKPGVFKRLCERAKLDPQHRYAIFIDEINRGNVAKILGELITLIEVDKRAHYDSDGLLLDGMELTLPYSGEHFGVPRNLDIYGSMNTADRSIALLDAALRRRFQFRELMPDSLVISGAQGDGYIPDGEGGVLNLRALLDTLNRRISYLLHRDQTIGHAFFTRVRDMQGLRGVLCREVIPLLQETFYNDWQRIRLIFGDVKAPLELQIVREFTDSGIDVFGELEDSLPETQRFQICAPDEITPEAVRKIYEPLV
ncbi:AAA family ATPase [Pseudomonas paralcaligenes]|uniref:AAA family ATPase n=1 Tax=Pseudomonas paralcaligenes TaxID=2772558 RepID=UPI001C7E67D7|nr:AAA family ATPase [Pseudomonas paralcaligenes]